MVTELKEEIKNTKQKRKGKGIREESKR